MYRKLIVSFTVIILFSLVIAPVGVVQAQDPQPPQRTMTPLAPPHYPPQTSSADLKSGLDVTKMSITSSMETVTALASPVALGQPGLSFRFVQTFGETEVPYLADTAYLNYPYGLGTDGNNVWIAEMWGNRALKYTNSGSFQQQIGIAGLVLTGET